MDLAESGKLAARHNLVEIAEACWRGPAKSGHYPDRIVRCYLSRARTNVPDTLSGRT